MRSRAPDRTTYLKRPDLGRELEPGLFEEWQRIHVRAEQDRRPGTRAVDRGRDRGRFPPEGRGQPQPTELLDDDGLRLGEPEAAIGEQWVAMAQPALEGQFAE